MKERKLQYQYSDFSGVTRTLSYIVFVYVAAC